MNLIRNFVLLFVVLIFFQELCLAQPLRIGFTPSGDTLEMKKAIDKISFSLAKELGTPVEGKVSSSYSQLVSDLTENKIEFAMMNGFAFVENEQKAGLKVLLKKIWDSPFYYSSIIVLASSKYKKIQNLKGAKIAYVDTKSTSGYLYSQLAFRKANLSERDFAQVVFSGSHKESVALLESKKVDAISVFSDDPQVHKSAWQKVPKDYGTGTTCWRWYQRWQDDHTWTNVLPIIDAP